MLQLLFAATLLAGLAAGGAAWWLAQPYRGYASEGITVTVPSGWNVRQILTELERVGVVRSALATRLLLIYQLGDPPLQAGEYRFDLPLGPAAVLDKLTRGEVVTYPLTIIEGLTLDETAEAIANAGFGNLADLRQRVYDPTPIRDLDPLATDLEGYLFPETYLLAKGTSSGQVIAAQLDAFRAAYQREIASLLATPAPPREAAGARPNTVSAAPPVATLRELVILASIVEKEAQLPAERPLVAAVYRNRLDRGIGLYADPTIIYALKRLGRFDGNLRKADLAMDSPYNTYRVAGLPPGPICSPGLAALRAAARPADVPYLYFVSRNDGSHVFASTLAEHNHNVEVWQRRYWRQRWANEPPSGRRR